MRSRMLTMVLLTAGFLMAISPSMVLANPGGPMLPVPDSGTSGLLLALALGGIVTAKQLFFRKGK